MTEERIDDLALLRVGEFAKLLQVDRATIHRWQCSGRIPSSIHIGRCVRRRAAEIRDWINAGCPAAGRWRWPRADESRRNAR